MDELRKSSISEERVRERAYEIYLEEKATATRWRIGYRRKSNWRNPTTRKGHKERRNRCAQLQTLRS